METSNQRVNPTPVDTDTFYYLDEEYVTDLEKAMAIYVLVA